MHSRFTTDRRRPIPAAPGVILMIAIATLYSAADGADVPEAARAETVPSIGSDTRDILPALDVDVRLDLTLGLARDLGELDLDFNLGMLQDEASQKRRFIRRA